MGFVVNCWRRPRLSLFALFNTGGLGLAWPSWALVVLAGRLTRHLQGLWFGEHIRRND